MKIGLAMPVSLQRMQDLVTVGDPLPVGYPFAPAVDWVRELLRCGHEITVYTTARDVVRDVTCTGPRLAVRIAKARASGAGRDLFRAERIALTRMMQEDRCDVIHAHWTYEFALAALVSGRPALITVHDLPWNVLRYFRDGHRLAKLLMAYRAAMQGVHFTAVSKDAANHFRRYFAPWAQVSIVPNGLPEAVFQMLPETPPQPKHTLTFATNLQGWSARKNAATALRAFAEVRAKLPGAKLLMFGTDYGPGGLAELWATQNQLATDVTFVGQLDYSTLLERIADSVDVLVHPSLDESFSMASLEAMALRKPVIAGAGTPGVREVLGYGTAGVLVDITRADALAAAMLRLAVDPAYRASLAVAGYARAFEMYRLQAVFHAYQALYQQLHRENVSKETVRSASHKSLTTTSGGSLHVD